MRLQKQREGGATRIFVLSAQAWEGLPVLGVVLAWV